ncbi:hypothetical protein [Altererythrobacter sp.]|uniref:hypothetical protein n=1 Tax=Altererythrobacter sp. TaxID=1872480 RepID=UPI003D017DBC
MNLPQLDLASLPGLDIATGVFGSIAPGTGPYDDKIVAIMVYVYETTPVTSLV